MFAQKDVYEAERAEQLGRMMAAWQGKLPNLEIVSGMIAAARARGVALTLVITPHHGDALEAYWRIGLWPRVEQLKTELADLVAEQHGAVKLWDFMDYNSFTTELVPAADGRRTATIWFWEPTHFKKQLGSIMIGRMFGGSTETFGTMLTPNNVAMHNAAVRERRKALVCGTGVRFLTVLDKPLEDGCVRAERAVAIPG